jgi:DNA topoisomerase-1
VTTDFRQLARRAGLRYRLDDRPGIERRRRGRGFSYAGPRGGRISPADLERIRGLVIPPAWTDVWIAPEPNAHLQATGIDAAGRKQYRYHTAWRDAADVAKFDRLAGFAPALAVLRQRVAHDLRARNGDLLCATVTRLIDRCLIRPGSRRPTASDAAGATELGPAQVVAAGSTVVLDFVGKSGVDQHVEVHDRVLSRVLSELLDRTDDGGALFCADDDAVDGRRLNAYIGEASRSDFTAKDFRTWGATATVVGELGGADSTSGKPRVVERAAIAAAAEVLGNSVAVCKASYVAPAVLDSFESGELAHHWRVSRRGKWLSRAERATARVLDAAAH